MNITVAICTWNRARLLDQTLRQMQRLAIPDGLSWELLVVNNNCSDETDEVIRKHEGDLPLRRLFEKRPGKSFALNRAAREARGRYILWTDDDALVDEHWILRYLEAFRSRPRAALFGGPVRPWFSEKPPRWLERVLPQVGSAFALRDLGPRPLRFTEQLVPYGVNMAVRTEEQRRYRYDTNLGPRPESSLRREDTMMVRGMLAAGEEGWWVPGAVVRHYIPKERQTVRYLRSYYRGEGEYGAQLLKGYRGRTFLGKPLWLWRSAVTAEVRYRIGRIHRRPEAWVEDLITSSNCWGNLRS